MFLYSRALHFLPNLYKTQKTYKMIQCHQIHIEIEYQLKEISSIYENPIDILTTVCSLDVSNPHLLSSIV